MSGPSFDPPGGYVIAGLLEAKEEWPGGISYATIARRAKLSKAHVVRLFQGKGNPSVSTLVAISNALDRTLSFELLHDTWEDTVALASLPQPNEQRYREALEEIKFRDLSAAECERVADAALNAPPQEGRG